MNSEDGDGTTCFTPGCGSPATGFYEISGGTRFLCAACDHCGEQLVSIVPVTIAVEAISFEQFAVEQVMEETRGASYLAFTGGPFSRLPPREADGAGS